MNAAGKRTTQVGQSPGMLNASGLSDRQRTRRKA